MLGNALLTVMVADFDKAVKFYTEAVGLPLRRREGDGWAEVQAPGLTIGLHPRLPDMPASGGPNHLSVGFAVENLEAAMAELEARGVKFSGVQDGQGVRFAHFADPDGTPLYLAQHGPH
jgi:predicted enzyme related to lactoylglutathione lyase